MLKKVSDTYPEHEFECLCDAWLVDLNRVAKYLDLDVREVELALECYGLLDRADDEAEDGLPSIYGAQLGALMHYLIKAGMDDVYRWASMTEQHESSGTEPSGRDGGNHE